MDYFIVLHVQNFFEIEGFGADCVTMRLFSIIMATIMMVGKKDKCHPSSKRARRIQEPTYWSALPFAPERLRSNFLQKLFLKTRDKKVTRNNDLLRNEKINTPVPKTRLPPKSSWRFDDCKVLQLHVCLVPDLSNSSIHKQEYFTIVKASKKVFNYMKHKTFYTEQC